MLLSAKKLPMNTQYSSKEFHFTDELDIIELSCSSSDSLNSETEKHICGDNCLNIRLNEILNPDFGLYIWPCAPVLGKYVWTQRKNIQGKVLIELGAGTALPSVVAAKCGAKVIITDSQKYECVLELEEHNMQSNSISSNQYKINPLTWGKFTPFIINIGSIDIILGSDVFYDPGDFEDVLVTVSYLLRRNTKAEFWTTYEHRCSDWSINYLLEKWDLKSEMVSLDEFGADKFNVAGADLPGLKSISLYIISYKCEGLEGELQDSALLVSSYGIPYQL